MIRILVHHDAGPCAQRAIDQRRDPDLDIVCCAIGDRERYRQQLAVADVLFHVLDPVTDEVIAAAPRLRLIQKLGVGVNTIDLDAARRRGVMVANLPGVNRQAVAEHTLLLMLAALRRLPMLHEATKEGRGWDLPLSATDGAGELGGRRVGFVGYGAIPQTLTPVLTALGCDVVHHRRRADLPGWMPLDDLLASADVISVHLPATPETERLFDANRLARCRPGAIFVNTGRGECVDEAALAGALRSGHLGAAALDVFEREPLSAGSPLADLPNVILTPHVAWLTDETFARCLDRGIENARRVATGRDPQHRVV